MAAQIKNNMAERGKFIVIEGTDGSGKGTQIKPLAEHLTNIGEHVEIIDFPQYTDNLWGGMIGKYLKGEFGSLYQIDPHYAALPYMLDRIVAKPKIKNWVNNGKFVIANRYAPSNLAFMAAKMPDRKARDEFIKWMEQAEYDENKIPRENMVLLLNVTPDLSQKNVDKKAQRGYLGNKKRDIHEDDINYQRKVAEVYLHLGKTHPHWQVIDCMEGQDMKPPEVITQLLVDALVKKGIIHG